MPQTIARQALLILANDADCARCGHPSAIVLQGGATCHMCSNQINLCSACAAKMVCEVATVLSGQAPAAGSKMV